MSDTLSPDAASRTSGSTGRRLLAECLHGLLYWTASYLLLQTLHTVDRAPLAGPGDPPSVLFLFGAMAVLRLIALQSGLRGWQAVILPALFVCALPFTFLQRTDRHDFGEWFALLLIAYVAIGGSRWLTALAICLTATATPMAIWMPVILWPTLARHHGWQSSAIFVVAISAIGWTVGILAEGHALTHSLVADLQHLAYSWRKGWMILVTWQNSDIRHLLKLVPSGANLLNMLVLALLLERYVLAASRASLASLAIALACCLALSILNRQLPSHLLALVIAPLFCCMVEGVRRAPPLLRPPVPEAADQQSMQRG